MKQHTAAISILMLVSGLALALCACSAGQTSAPGLSPGKLASAAAASASAAAPAATAAPTASQAASAKPTATAKPVATTKPTATAKAPSTDAFKFYKLIDIGMTKAQVDKAIGVKPKAATGANDPANSYYYLDGKGNGVYVQYSKSLKLTSKTVQYEDPAEALLPYTAKPVTQEQCDKITNGMSHADVVKLLGSKGAQCNKTQSVIFGETVIGTIYRWGNENGSFLQVVFTSKDTAMNAMFFSGSK